MNKLLEAAKAVIDSKHCEFRLYGTIEALRQAVQDADHIPDVGKMVYVPMTDDELIDIADDAESKAFRMSSYVTETGYEGHRAIERATIERLGLKWPL